MSLGLESSEKEDDKGNVGDGVEFQRVRRITGYLVGDYRARFNNAKRAEVESRVKHGKF